MKEIPMDKYCDFYPACGCDHECGEYDYPDAYDDWDDPDDNEEFDDD